MSEDDTVPEAELEPELGPLSPLLGEEEEEEGGLLGFGVVAAGGAWGLWVAALGMLADGTSGVGAIILDEEVATLVVAGRWDLEHVLAARGFAMARCLKLFAMPGHSCW